MKAYGTYRSTTSFHWFSIFIGKVLSLSSPYKLTFQSFILTFAEKGNIHLEYEQKVQLLALYKQEKLGPHTPDKDNETGYFDVVGGDRRLGISIITRILKKLQKYG